MRRRREFEIFTMSFLDAICCGFGSMILLFIVTRVSEPQRLEESKVDLHGVIAQYEQELNDILGETDRIRRDVSTTASDFRTEEKSVETLRTELERIRQEVLATVQDAKVSNEVQGKLAIAKQSLTEEMKRLLVDYKPAIGEYKIGGIPVDSEYIIFIIDTSGSMKNYAWDRAIEQLRQTLEVYPTVKGIQVMDDEGVVMFKSYRNEWIPDTPARRKAILDGMRNWDAYSNSSPREGILAALEGRHRTGRHVDARVLSQSVGAERDHKRTGSGGGHSPSTKPFFKRKDGGVATRAQAVDRHDDGAPLAALPADQLGWSRKSGRCSRARRTACVPGS